MPTITTATLAQRSGSNITLTVEIAWNSPLELALGYMMRVEFYEEDRRSDDYLMAIDIPISASPTRPNPQTIVRDVRIGPRLDTEITDEEVYAIVVLNPATPAGSLTATRRTPTISVDY
ncbi:MAG: hypothetical protein AB7V40_06030 [Methyloceanibacter sp.]